jgi:hypothetical protein
MDDFWCGPVSVSDDARDRLHLVLAESGLVPVDAPELIASPSNDAWMLDDAELGPVVLRVCWRGDRQRLLREAAVARHLAVPERRALPVAAWFRYRSRTRVSFSTCSGTSSALA